MKEKPKKVESFLNPIASLHLINEASYKTLIAGRGFSKSTTNGLEIADKVERMPRSSGLFNSPTYSQIYTKTLIPMKFIWSHLCDYIEDIHYVVGKVPPKSFERPYFKPHKYENVVTFWNGTTITFGSFDRPALISGGSYDWVITDEAYLIDKDEYDAYVIPTMRGTHPSFKTIAKHLQNSFTSSMPHRNMGDWLLDYRAKSLADPNNYNFLGWAPNEDVQMGSTWMNVDILGVKAILQMEIEMNTLDCMIMIHNQRVTNYGNTFYPQLSSKHFYTPQANEKMITVPIGALSSLKRDASYDVGPDDYNPDLPLNISHDWGKFNCITVDQEHVNEVRFINFMHVFNGGAYPKDQDDLADDFCEYYRMHKNRIVYQWGDRTGNNKVANSKKTYFEQFADRLRAKDWRVIMKKTGDVEHLARHRLISIMHKEEDPRFPRIRHNANNCADLRISLEAAGMKKEKKDKGSENNPSIKPQHATHPSDAYDNRLYHGFKHRESQTDMINAYTTNLS